jgi:hypothetical protein
LSSIILKRCLHLSDEVKFHALSSLEERRTACQHQLNGIRAAAKALGGSASEEVATVKKRVMSAAARAKIGKATKKRWAKFRAQAKKVTG